MRTLGSLKGQDAFGRTGASLAYAVQGLRLGRASSTKNKRKAQASRSTEAFCRTYLPHHFTSGFCEFHRDIFALLDNPPPERGKRIIRVGPRKFGKTTVISLASPLKALAFQEKHFILLIGESSTTAISNLASITQELETNEKLLEDFPHLAPAKDAKGQLVKWTDEEIVIANYATVRAKGMGSRMRGMKYRNYRPDLAILDDPESPETADTFLKRRRHKRWFGGTFMGLGADNWDVFVVSNLPHHDCLAADLLRNPEWNGKLFRAINIPPRPDERYPVGNTVQDGSALWPDVWPLDALDAYRADPNIGGIGFSREMMSDPRDEEDKIFDLSRFSYFDFNADNFRNDYAALCVGVDPAGGEKPGDFKRGVRDWCVMVVGGRRKDGYVDVFDVEMTRKPPEDQIQLLLKVLQRWGIRNVQVEENMFKNLYEPSINAAARAKGIYPAVTVIHNTTNKIGRIQGLQPICHAGTVRFARHLIESKREYFAQFDEFPAQFDDAPDGTEILVRALEKKVLNAIPEGASPRTSYWKGRS